MPEKPQGAPGGGEQPVPEEVKADATAAEGKVHNEAGVLIRETRGRRGEVSDLP